jgi:hypothetical protein
MRLACGERAGLLLGFNVKRVQRTLGSDGDPHCMGKNPGAQIGEISRVHDRLKAKFIARPPGSLSEEQ